MGVYFYIYPAQYRACYRQILTHRFATQKLFSFPIIVLLLLSTEII